MKLLPNHTLPSAMMFLPEWGAGTYYAVGANAEKAMPNTSQMRSA